MRDMLKKLDSGLCQAYRLVWQPGATLHTDWWQFWDLQHFQVLYFDAPVSTQRRIDTHIIRLCGLADWKPASLSSLQQDLVRIRAQLPVLLSALGLMAFGCANYFHFRHYRKVLSTLFSAQQLAQMSLLLRGAGSAPNIPPDELLQACLAAGITALDKSLVNDPLWQRLFFTLPRHSSEVKGDLTFADPVKMLLRLERFL